MKTMKKALAVLMAVAIVMTFASTAFAAGESKSIKFLNDFINSKTVGVKLDEVKIPEVGLSIKNAEIKAKFEGENKTKAAAKADIGPLSNVRIFANGNDLTGYFAIFKINVKEFVGDSFDVNAIANEFYPMLEKLNKDTVDMLALKETKDVNLEGYGAVQAEILTVSPDKIAEKITAEAIKQGKTDAELEGKDITALVELAREINIEELNYYIALYTVSQSDSGIASFYYKDGNLVGFRLNLVDEETLENESIDTTEAIGLKVKSIVTNLSDSDFNAPAFAIDITGLVKFFLSFFMG